MPAFIATLLFVHFFPAAFPFQPVEGDDQNVVNGLLFSAHHLPDFRGNAYLFPIQPASFLLLEHALDWTHAEPFLVYGLFSLVGAIAFFAFAVALLTEWSGLRWPWVAVALLSAQEISATAAYANTSNFAGALALAALVFISDGTRPLRLVTAGVLLGAAGAFRLDALLIAPACWPLLADRSGDWRHATFATAKTAGIAVLTLGLFFACDRVSFAAAWNLYGTRGVGSSVKIAQFLPLTLSFPLWLAALIGFVRLIQKLDAPRVALVVFGVAPSLLAYGPNFTSPKYFLYAIPFAMLPAVAWLREVTLCPLVWARRGLLAWIVYALAYAFVGMRTIALPWQRFHGSPASAPLFSVHIGNLGAIFVFGSGDIIGTADGFRLVTGTWYAPEVWRREKRAMAADRERLHEQLASVHDATVLTGSYLSEQVVWGELLEQGFAPDGFYFPFWNKTDSHARDWTMPGRRVRTVLICDTRADAAEFADAARRFRAEYFVNDRGSDVARHFRADEPEWTCLSPSEDNLITVYRRNVSTP